MSSSKESRRFEQYAVRWWNKTTKKWEAYDGAFTGRDRAIKYASDMQRQSKIAHQVVQVSRNRVVWGPITAE